ncbi:unnamed protein product [Caenorhabditis auriculariae]|uniref:Uncharacterized protein n=1 Tax=Caenorhabditis auriculariae TaxID=2777116 RepID=A0A8S1GY78_9PELO|nr:unnamed protein product [Caenorhabditis auriculariae]
MLHRDEEHIAHLTASVANHLNTNGLFSTLSDERNSTDRSSATPSHNDDNETQDMLDEDVKDEVIKNGVQMLEETTTEKKSVEERLKQLDSNFVYIQHQLARVMRQMHVSPCNCATCASVHQKVAGVRQINDPGHMLASLFPNASHQQLQTLVELSKMNKLPSQVVTSAPSSTPTTPSIVAPPYPSQRIGSGYGSNPGGGKIVTSVDRKAVAEYAKMHGGAAAAKKFGVPPPVATYYQRKDSSNSLIPTTPVSAVMPQLPLSAPHGGSATASPGPSSEGDREENGNATPAVSSAFPAFGSQSSVTECSTPSSGGPPNLGQPMFAQSMVDMLKMNAAHATGSPGFLRGRGRGRPKLIGDELDADLVDYMVTVKQSDPHGHLTASQALQIAKQYILDRAPGLLEEHGGHVKLKLTWAMKLVSRITERQKEIELGLPAGTLSNIGRQQLNNLPGGNFMADMMAQNILSQHMFMNLNGIGGAQKGSGSDDSTNGHNEENMHVATPEILNVKELHFPLLANMFENGEKSGLVEGEIPSTNDDDDEEEDGMEIGVGTI